MPKTSHVANMLMMGYLAVLACHFFYAVYLIAARKTSLAVGKIRSAPAILISLLLINGFSLTAILWPIRGWVLLNVVYHVALTADELWRLRRDPLRWPFAANHVFFAVILASAPGVT